VIDLTPAWRDFTFTFTAESVVAKNHCPGFSLAQEKGTVWLKAVPLAEKRLFGSVAATVTAREIDPRKGGLT
jgi:hypothetical protein